MVEASVLQDQSAIVIVAEEGQDAAETVGTAIDEKIWPDRDQRLAAAVDGPAGIRTFVSDTSTEDDVRALEKWLSQMEAVEKTWKQASADDGGISISPANYSASAPTAGNIDISPASIGSDVYRWELPSNGRNTAQMNLTQVPVWSCANEEYFQFVNVDYSVDHLAQRGSGHGASPIRSDVFLQMAAKEKNGSVSPWVGDPREDLWSGNRGASLNEATPQTTLSKTSVTSGFTWGIDGGVGIDMSGPTASVGPSLSWDTSTTTEMPSVDIQLRTDNAFATANWQMNIANPRPNGNFQFNSAGWFWRYKQKIDLPWITIGQTTAKENGPVAQQAIDFFSVKLRDSLPEQTCTGGGWWPFN